MANKLIDLTGQRFGRLTVIKRVENDNRENRPQWLCKCDCGNTKIVTGCCLRRGNTTSCGCFQREETGNRFRTHGLSKKGGLYGIWHGIKERCLCQTHKDYKRYGGRGITICKEWKDSFEAFQKWALENGYKKGLTVDRKDNQKGYSPENCRIATTREQANNRSNNHLITFAGETLTLAEAERKYRLPRGIILQRLRKGWNLEKAVTTRPMEQFRRWKQDNTKAI